MDVIDVLLSRVKAFNEGLQEGTIMQAIILDNEPYIVDMNAEAQLYEQGINRLGVSIADYQPYSAVTIEIKRAKGQPYDRVTLRDEGDFESSFFVTADNEKFEIKASDSKTEELVTRYSDYILGLTDENRATLAREYVLPDLLKKAKEIIYETN